MPKYFPTGELAEVVYSASENGKRPWVAYVRGEMLRDSRGAGRRFATEAAAQLAADLAV